MSLSDHLASKKSPVYAWFEEHFPNTGAVARNLNPSLRAQFGHVCPIEPVEGADTWLTGTAAGYLIESCLGRGALDSTSATRGAAQIEATLEDIEELRVKEIERTTVSSVYDLEPWTWDLSEQQLSELCERCLVLARFEQVRRSGSVVVLFQYVLPALTSFDGDLRALSAGMASEATREDLTRVGKAIIEDYRDIADLAPIVVNPVFDQSAALGGADADVIIARTLMDFKAVKSKTIVGRGGLWQLLGYSLADSSNQYSIERVEISNLRWRVRPSWTLQQLLEDLGAPSGSSIEGLRNEFANLMKEVETQHLKVGSLSPGGTVTDV